MARAVLWLWRAANLTIADYALGLLPVNLGLPLAPTLMALGGATSSAAPSSPCVPPWALVQGIRRCSSDDGRSGIWAAMARRS
jgi:hypothetical protein